MGFGSCSGSNHPIVRYIGQGVDACSHSAPLGPVVVGNDGRKICVLLRHRQGIRVPSVE